MRFLRTLLVAGLISMSGAIALPQISVADTGGVTATATLNGTDLGSTTRKHPVQLVPGAKATLSIEVTNHGSTPVSIRQGELAGRVLGLLFFDYISALDTTVGANTTTKIEYSFPLGGLKGQATGLIAGGVTLRDGNDGVVVNVPFVSDVRGSLFSVFGLFGAGLLVLTLLAIADTALAISRNALPANRFQRGLRLMVPGIGIGLVTAFTASVARLWVPHTGPWLLFAASVAAVCFLIGYSTLAVKSDDEPLDDEALEDLDIAGELSSHNSPD